MAAAATFLTMSTPYRRARVLAFLHPSEDPLNPGYQTIQSLVGVASGGLAGVGLGASRAKWGFLPDAHTDFIFAIIGEELGFVGAWSSSACSSRSASSGSRRPAVLPTATACSWPPASPSGCCVQAFVNIGAVVGVLPITGVPLPFVSFGGSSLVTTMAGTGLLLNIARQGSPTRSRGR